MTIRPLLTVLAYALAMAVPARAQSSSGGGSPRTLVGIGLGTIAPAGVGGEVLRRIQINGTPAAIGVGGGRDGVSTRLLEYQRDPLTDWRAPYWAVSALVSTHGPAGERGARGLAGVEGGFQFVRRAGSPGLFADVAGGLAFPVGGQWYGETTVLTFRVELGWAL